MDIITNHFYGVEIEGAPLRPELVGGEKDYDYIEAVSCLMDGRFEDDSPSKNVLMTLFWRGGGAGTL